MSEPGSFSPAGFLHEPRAYHTTTLLPDGRVLVVGGSAEYRAADEWPGDAVLTEVWDPATSRFSPAGTLDRGRFLHTSTLLPDGRVLVIGGAEHHVFGGIASAVVWDPVTSTYSAAGVMPEGRSSHTATLLPDGRVLVVGGVDMTEADRTLASALIWDPATATFSPAGSLAEPRVEHTATLLPDGRVLIVGGIDWTESQRSAGAAEIWDPETATFSPAGELEASRWGHAAVLLPDGRVLVVGGAWRRLSEIWDPETATFSPGGELARAREARTTAALLSDGRALVISVAYDGNIAQGWSELWDPTTESFVEAASLDISDRQYHAASLLQDGRVLVVGGKNGDGEIGSAEVWAP